MAQTISPGLTKMSERSDQEDCDQSIRSKDRYLSLSCSDPGPSTATSTAATESKATSLLSLLRAPVDSFRCVQMYAIV